MEEYIKRIKRIYHTRKDEIFIDNTIVFNVEDFTTWPPETAYGVYKINLNNRDIAVKFMRLKEKELSDVDILYQFYEISQLRRLKNRNIVNFYGIHLFDGYLFYFMEWCDISLKKLYKKVHEKLDHFPEIFLGYITVEIVEGLEFCHKQKLFNLNLNSSNVLVDREGNIKLSDFGNFRFQYSRDICLCWPPERIRQPQNFPNFTFNTQYGCNERTDVWSLGIILSEMAYNKMPFDEDLLFEQVKLKIENYKNSDFNGLFKKCFVKGRESGWSKDPIKFIKSCLCIYEDRKSVQSLKNEKFYAIAKKLMEEGVFTQMTMVIELAAVYTFQ